MVRKSKKMKSTKNKKKKLVEKSKKSINIFKKKINDKRKRYCAPKNDKNDYSCFSKSSLINIIKEWNNKNNNKIKFSEKNSSKILWNKINDKLSKKCHSEWCWVQEDFIKNMNNKEIKETFRPKTPIPWYENKKDWLSTIDIEKVMKQYEKVYDDFVFIGPTPIDFDYKFSMNSCVMDELCNINVMDNIKNNKKKIGIVFNLDKHYDSGSHWVAMFVDLYKNHIYYFDSYGFDPEEEIDVLIKRIMKQAKENKLPMKYEKNDIRHQYNNSECGVYCMDFIVRLLKGESFKSIKSNKIKDETMNLRRDIFYTPSKYL